MLAPNVISAETLFRPRTKIESDGTVEGYASLFGEVDAARDMMMPGAFRETLRLRGLRRIPMLFQHDPAEPVGVWLELREDHRGLYARGRLIPEVARARELFALVASGAVDGLSIGFRTVKGRVDPRSRIRKIDQVELWEISIVTFPLLAGARVRAVKEARFSSQPKPSFARARAEREWASVWQGDTPPCALDTQSLARLGAPSAKRLETVHARRQSPPRRDRIRGWISEQAVRSTSDRKAMFATPAR
jgi:Escherichia/Staphylococcus phage prohead protease